MKNCILILFLFTICFKGFGQSENIEIPNLSPPSPTAFELGKYGMESVGLFTGTPNVNIPLYTYKTSKISVPLYLSYNSNGIKVDQLATNVGLGWSLNSGGVITRLARDGSDEHSDYFFPEEEISQIGARSPMALDFFWMAGQGGIDTELDLFSYNFLGHSGKFIIDNDKKIVEMPKSGLKIENYADGNENGFMISTPDGMKYIFLEREETISRVSGSGHSIPGLPITTAWYLTKISHPSGETVNFVYQTDNYSYTATKSQTLQVLNPANQSACVSISQNSIFPSPSTTLNSNITIAGKKLVEINSSAEKMGKLLFTSNLNNPESSSNLVENLKVLDFNSQITESIDLEYYITGNNRVFLNKVLFKDPNKNYELSYFDMEGFPMRHSFSQDHWGYFNGKNNSYAFPNPQTLDNVPTSLAAYNNGADKSPNSSFAVKGLLQRIKYPTKGFTEFEYETNSYRGIETINSPQTSIALTADTGAYEMGPGYDDVKTIYIPFTQEVDIFVSAYFNNNNDPECVDTGKSKSHISIQNSSGSYVNLYKRQSSGIITNLGSGYLVGPDASDNIQANLIGGNTYTITLSSSFECVLSGANIKYYAQSAQTVESNIPTGGLRIKRLKKYIQVGGTPELTRYYYGKKEDLNISSADAGQKPYYLSNITQRIACSATIYNDVYYLNLNSNSLRKLYNSSGINTTYYEYVTTSHGGDNFENGGEENQFYIDRDYPGNPLWGNPIDTAPFNNNGWKNGLIKNHSIFKLNGAGDYTILKNNSKNYVQDQRLYDEVLGYAVYKKYDLTFYGDVTYECTSADLNKVYERRYCTTDHDHLRGPLPFDGRDYWVCTKFNANNVVDTYLHPCNEANGGYVGQIITNSNYLENLDITEYTNYSFWFYLSSEVNTIYDKDGNNPIVALTEYFYDNPLHLQLSRTETTDSKGNTIVSKSYYPDDVLNVNGLSGGSLTNYEYQEIDKMKAFKEDGNFGEYYIGVPVQSEIYLKNSSGINLSESIKRTLFKEFNNSILPEKIQTSKGSSVLEDRVVFNSYSPSGNPTEISQAGGPPIVYLWGYDAQFPIAKIENATYQEVATALGVSTIALDEYNESNLTVINALRNNSSLSKAMVTTYTYEPLVGLKTITDSKGFETTYEYDAFNRLKLTRDEDNNILKEYDYHYKNN